MRILYLFRSLAVFGGIERILIDKMNYLSTMYDFEVYMITSDQGNHSVPYIINKKVHLEDLDICFYRQYQFSFLKRLLVRRKMIYRYEQLLSDRLAKIHPDIIVCTTADNITSIVKVKGSIPLIVESHSICIRTINSGSNWLIKRLNRFAYLRSLRKVDLMVALTEGDAKEWKKFHPSVEIIPNFIQGYDGESSGQSSKRVIFVGRFDYQKRVQDAIRIWSIVYKQFPEWHLDIYGDGEMKEVIEILAEDVGGITIHSPTDKIFECYRDSSILISTSLFEPFGLVIPEAMSCGLPVVAFDCPYGPANNIAEGKDGFLIKNRDIPAFSEKVCLLIGNKEMRKRMGHEAVISSQRYHPDMIMKKWKTLFEAVSKK